MKTNAWSRWIRVTLTHHAPVEVMGWIDF